MVCSDLINLVCPYIPIDLVALNPRPPFQVTVSEASMSLMSVKFIPRLDSFPTHCSCVMFEIWNGFPRLPSPPEKATDAVMNSDGMGRSWSMSGSIERERRKVMQRANTALMVGLEVMTSPWRRGED